MDTPDQTSPTAATLTSAVAASLGASAVACASWAVIGLFVARTLAIGLILLPLVAGVGSGLLMKLTAKGFHGRTGVVAIFTTLIGCVIGDFLWFALVPNQLPISELLTSNLVGTLDTVFNLQKAVMYAAACYIAYAISNPPKLSAAD